MKKIILTLIILLLPAQVLACNCGCGHNGCGNSNPPQPQGNVQNVVSCGNQTNITTRTNEPRLCVNSASSNKNKYNCGGNQK